MRRRGLSSTCGHEIMSRPYFSHFIGAAHYVQVVRIDARCSLWLCVDTSTGRRHATLDTAGKSASAVRGQYNMPQVSSLVGSRSFYIASPQAWNQLSASLHHTNCVATFKRHLQTILFMEAYGATDN